MKTIFIILSIIISYQCLSQKWHLENIDTTEKFGYEYWFRFENKEDTNTFKTFRESGNQNLLVRLLNNKNDTVLLANVVITELSTDSVTVLHSDYNGLVSIKLDTGSYKVEVYDSQYDKFELELKIKPNQDIFMEIKLGLAPQHGFYEIHSKNELSETQILKLINCMRDNRRNRFEYCSKKNKYIILMQI